MGQTKTSFRWKLAGLMFFISFISYMDRVNLSVATPTIMQELGFTKMDMGFIQTAFFVGYALMQIPGGIMSEFWGHRRVLAIAATWWSAFTVLTGACSNFTSFILARSLFGIGEGPMAPAFGRFIYRWFNNNEKGRASSFMLSGVFFGPVVGPTLTILLMMNFGWRSVFIIFGGVGLLLAALWYYLAKDTPHESKFTNAAEADYIEEGLMVDSDKKELAPWRAFLGSSQFWAIGIQYFITDYIMYVFLAWLPLYLIEAQNFSLQKMGIAASFPWAALCIVTATCGYISDKLVASGVSRHKSRTLFGILGLIICCITLYLGAVATVPWLNVLWLTISLGSLGLTFNASWAACLDIGGKFAGSITGWMNFWGNMGGIAAPVATAWVATNYGWQAAILTTAASAVIGIVAWLAVKPDRPLVLKENNNLEKIA
ncbi:MFS transporter [Pelosinus baikalensis]|uniref:MFS transporter n=1 Tax=Pelosinus baikalensis TaxID=2892015 RepID=A0ABS8HXD3_9FIRM|nr:MFS transporter [Pelosinus baikalensis]MCC5467823.1 MFS transporter [Pelosinus baikalensis]